MQELSTFLLGRNSVKISIYCLLYRQTHLFFAGVVAHCNRWTFLRLHPGQVAGLSQYKQSVTEIMRALQKCKVYYQGAETVKHDGLAFSS